MIYKKFLLSITTSILCIPLLRAELPGHYLFTPKAVGFDIKSESDLYISPSCMRKKGIELVILDPGHDDSSASQRSDVNGKFKWPEVHEGQSNMVSAFLALEYALINPKLSVSEQKELRTMIRLSRHPGEKYFGDLEQSAGYGVRSGLITSGVENRPGRVNAMAANHRPYDPTTQSYSTNQKVNVTSKSLLISVHANSTDAWDSGDYIWLIAPKSGVDTSLMNNLKAGFSTTWANFFKVLSTDTSADASLKRGAASSANLDKIRTGPHTVNLAMLGSQINISKKTLLEGWVMNGKVGHLSYNDIKVNAPREKLEIYRGGSLLKSYDASEVYKTYGKSIVRGLNKYFGCGS
jgi:hypothetical protein